MDKDMDSEDSQVTYISRDIHPFYMGGSPITLSLNGKFLITALLDDIVIVNPKTNKIIDQVEGDGGSITCLQITPDGKMLAVCSISQQFRLYDLEKKKFVKNFKLPSPVYTMTADSTSTLIVCGGSDGSINIYDLDNKYLTHHFNHSSTISSLSIYNSENKKTWLLASGDTLGNMKVFDLIKRKQIYSSQSHNSTIRGLDFSANGDHLLSGGRDKIVQIYEINNKFKTIKTIPSNQQIESAGFVILNGNEYYFTAGDDPIIKVWDYKNDLLIGNSVQTLKTNEELMMIQVLKVSSNLDDGNTTTDKLFANISDQTIIEFDLTDIVTLNNTDKFLLKHDRTLAGNHGIISDLRFVSPNKNLLALATNSPSLRVINPYENQFEVQILESHKDLLNSLDSTNDGLWIATTSKDHKAKIWKYSTKVNSFKLFATFSGHSSSVTCVTINKKYSTQPNFIITGSDDLTIKKWKIPVLNDDTDFDNSSFTPFKVSTSVYTRRAHEKDINSIDMSPNNECFATAGFDKVAKIWNTESGEIMGVLKGHKRGLWDIRFSLFDKTVATCSIDKTIKVWSVETFTCLKTFEGHSNSIQKIQFLRSDTWIVSVGADALVKIWDVKSGECLKTLDNHNNRIWALTVKDDGDLIVSADADGNISIWEDKTKETIAEANERKKQKIELEQSLKNHIFRKDWINAFLLALKLDHPMRLYNVINQCIISNDDPDSVLGSYKLEECIKKLTEEQILLLFKRIRNWNVNSRHFEIAQKIIKCILNNHHADKLVEIPGLKNLLESILPYSERHYSRINDLIDQSYLLDYTIKQIDTVSI
ncbi:U3 snoRNA-associated protein UTP13 [Ascoidea rubescens DSM 1968]|uniref:WD40 repeat-like protein n=1 Tax=Ascoidea rubescens DSM 1968 TaxID=1344418 RepID=A0A1D2VAT1_9ASCO|nr:WD40 repeat-like protein [Ascoidea rubescens DSM 1968]ODV58563.1 WD40 repeat-like protein [Ascoidea rubescens DSM 1968]